MTDTDLRTGLEVAVIGMAGKFPGAENIPEFWHNLEQGIEGISQFSDAELLAEGVAQELLNNPNYVKANGLLAKPYHFDPSLFGYPLREAEWLDPQLRVLHECAWETLENAGYDAQQTPLSIGVYTGSTDNILWLRHVFEMVESSPGDLFEAEALIKRDYFATRLAYKLGLTGPAINVQTACSTSLVAIHLAVQGLLADDCNMALAGGVSVQPKKEGYLYQEGMIGSPDGHCRAFDAKAKGTVGGEGVGLVLLKRLEDAEADGDCILAVIKGSAINNDGVHKVGFTAPSVEGQKQVIQAALEAAEVEPESVSYVECHGTGTPLGDPIEITALQHVFGRGDSQTDARNTIKIGAVKTNIGHLDAAAGVSGLIKTVLCMQHQYLPATLHFEQGNPAIDWQNSPFEVVAKGQVWDAPTGVSRALKQTPRRAGVSSFGIGGTNAHVVLEEYIDERQSGDSRQWQLLPISARSESALSKVSKNLQGYFEQQELEQAPLAQEKSEQKQLADISFTLQQGRRHLAYRQVALCDAYAQAKQVLAGEHPKQLLQGYAEQAPAVTFMFSGQGSQYLGMGAGLYRGEAGLEASVFKENVDACLDMIAAGSESEQSLKAELQSLLFEVDADVDAEPRNADENKAVESKNDALNQTHITQPALFIVEYALAKQLQYWGVQPDAMIGHSLGEYVAATLAGVFSLEDALKLVVVRGKLMGSVSTEGSSAGAMLSVELSAEAAQARLAESASNVKNALSLAADNSPNLCVVSGEVEAIHAFAEQLSAANIKHTLLRTSHAYHS
ncbi:type I polyketide synthase, partial [Alteromonas sp. a30]|uniref:type I polyketide synthase n=1 Tax=Alteromonas sp. a30 TaxID=2730917 RepID=UPI00227E4FC9